MDIRFHIVYETDLQNSRCCFDYTQENRIMDGNRSSRRHFIKQSALVFGGLLGTSLFDRSLLKPAKAAAADSRVVIIRDDQVLQSGNRFDTDVIQLMMDEGIRQITGITDVGEAWKSLFPGFDNTKVICIKVNCINSRMSSHPEVAYAIVNGLTRMRTDAMPFPENNIIIWDRTTAELSNAGYTENRSNSGIRCFGTDRSDPGCSSTTYSVAGISIRLSRILTDFSDYMINLSILKNHNQAGVTLSQKNHFGSCNNPGALPHGNGCDPYISALNALAPIRQKQVLNICDALYGVVSGGPGGSPQVTTKSLLLSTDCVALDYYGAEMLRENGCRTLSTARYINTSAQAPYDLGTNDPEKIELIKIENLSTDFPVATQGINPPTGFALFQNFPNPFNGATSLSFEITEPSFVDLRIYDIRGHLIRTLAHEEKSRGFYHVMWDGMDRNGRSVASGTYIAQLSTHRHHQTILMSFVK